LENIVTYVL